MADQSTQKTLRHLITLPWQSTELLQHRNLPVPSSHPSFYVFGFFFPITQENVVILSAWWSIKSYLGQNSRSQVGSRTKRPPEVISKLLYSIIHYKNKKKALFDQLKAAMTKKKNQLLHLTCSVLKSSIRSPWWTLLNHTQLPQFFLYCSFLLKSRLSLSDTAVFCHVSPVYVHESTKIGNSQHVTRQALLQAE